jgi:hypothetical protein
MVSLKDKRLVKMRAQNGLCYYCNEPMWDQAIDSPTTPDCHSPKRPLQRRCTAEHLRARCDGGSDLAHNIVAACWFCNKNRHARKRPMPPQTYQDYVRKRVAQGRWFGNGATSKRKGAQR